MEYKTLRTLYYGDKESYLKEYKSRYESQHAVHLDFEIKSNPAFFVKSAEVMTLAYEIAKEDKAVYVISQKLPGVAMHQYSKKCLLDELVLTNKIEGVRSSRKEFSEALETLQQQAKEKGKKKRFLSLVNKYAKLMQNEKISLEGCRGIRELYDEILLTEVAAENTRHIPDGKIFRKDIAEIYGQTGKAIHKGAYPESAIIEGVEKALKILHDQSIETLFRVCIFHYLFEYIHPFYDGNGRLGRFILSYSLRECLEPLLGYRISEIIQEDIKEYNKAFDTCNDEKNMGDLTPFLLMMLQMILRAITDLKDSLFRRYVQLERYKEIIPKLPNASEKAISAMYSLLIQAALFSEKGISKAEIVGVSGKSGVTIMKQIESIPQELIKKEKEGRITYYEIRLNELDKLL